MAVALYRYTLGIQHSGEPAPALAMIAAHVPEPPERPGEPQTGLRIPGALGGPGQRRAEVVVLGLQALQPRLMVRAGQVRLRLLRQREEVVQVPVAPWIAVAALHK